MDVSDIFYFSCSGEAEGGARGAGRGGGFDFLLKVPGEWGGSPEGEEPEAPGEGVCSELGNGGGAKYFVCLGPKCPPSFSSGVLFCQ